jgi:hypothetical protein
MLSFTFELFIEISFPIVNLIIHFSSLDLFTAQTNFVDITKMVWLKKA